MVENDTFRSVRIACDECGNTTDDYDDDEFHRMVREAKQGGWRIDNRRGQYFHTCPSCVGGTELDEFGL